MSLEDFQLLDNEPFDNSIIERDFLKIYNQQGAQLNQSDQNIDLFSERLIIIIRLVILILNFI